MIYRLSDLQLLLSSTPPPHYLFICVFRREAERVWCSQRAVAFLSLRKRRVKKEERAAEQSGREATPRSFAPHQPALPHGLKTPEATRTFVLKKINK